MHRPVAVILALSFPRRSGVIAFHDEVGKAILIVSSNLYRHVVNAQSLIAIQKYFQISLALVSNLQSYFSQF